MLANTSTVAWRLPLDSAPWQVPSSAPGTHGIRPQSKDITTPGDAAIAETPVRGPFTMWAQADIITQHQLDRTERLYYAQMDRMVPLLMTVEKSSSTRTASP